MSYQLKTQSGLDFFVCSSAFQKSIRRNLQHEALYFATEFYISGYSEYCWYRMRLICSEDVGLANPNLITQIQSLYQTFQDLKKKKSKHQPEKLAFVNAVLLLVRSPKSRLVDNYLCEYFEFRDTVEVPNLENMDFVFCNHTRIGKQKGRGADFFYETGGHIENLPDFLKEEEEITKNRIWRKEREKEAKGINPNQFQQELFEDDTLI